MKIIQLDGFELEKSWNEKVKKQKQIFSENKKWTPKMRRTDIETIQETDIIATYGHVSAVCVERD